MTQAADTLPDDISQLKWIISEQVLQGRKFEENISKYEIEIARQRGDLQRGQEDLIRIKAENEHLEELVKLLRHRLFGRKSESVRQAPEQAAAEGVQLGIFNEAEALQASASEPASEESPTIEVKGHRRRGKPVRAAIPEHLPREDVIVDLPEAEKRCPEGHALKSIGEDVSEQLDVIPAQIKVIRTIRKKYACPHCDGHVKRAPLPKTAIPKSMAAPGLLAHIATSKYSDGLPLYRQEHIWRRIGIDIPRATMAMWMIKVDRLLTPIVNLMEDELLAGGFVHADETRVQVLNEAGKSAESLSYMWVRGRKYPGARPIILFEYDPSRGGDVAKRLFVGYEGYLQADAYGGYNGVCSQAVVVRVGCMAHCRRPFFEAMKASAKGAGLASDALELIRRLYAVEDAIRDEDDIEIRHRIRQKQSKPILDEFRKWLDDHRHQAPPQSQIGKAMNYAHSEWAHLCRYIEDGRLSIDNNFVENAIRPFAVGRKNWLFSDSVAGAKASAAIYSVLVSAKLNGHNEYAYLRHLLERLPLADTVEDFEALLPHRLLPKDISPQSPKAPRESGQKSLLNEAHDAVA